MTRLILFLIRLKLGVKRNEEFRFTNQKNKHNVYYITSYSIRKFSKKTGALKYSNVSLNWLLDPCCEIEKVEVKE